MLPPEIEQLVQGERILAAAKTLFTPSYALPRLWLVVTESRAILAAVYRRKGKVVYNFTRDNIVSIKADAQYRSLQIHTEDHRLSVELADPQNGQQICEFAQRVLIGPIVST